MKSQSNVVPEKIWVKKIENNTATVVLRKDVIKSANRDVNDELQTFYEYDEVAIELVNRPQLEKYIERHFDELFMIGERFEFEKALPSNDDILLSVITTLMLEIDTINARLQTLEAK